MRLFFLIILISNFSFAKDYKLSKEEFLKRVKGGSITLNRLPSLEFKLPMVKDYAERIQFEKKFKEDYFTKQHQIYKNFDERMFYIAYVMSNNFMYFLFYEWYNRGCIFGISNKSLYKDDPSHKDENNRNALKEMKNFEVIENSYCEKELGIKTPGEFGGLKR